jgi:hypothetical protein
MEKDKVICAEHGMMDGACGVDVACNFDFDYADSHWSPDNQIAKWKPEKFSCGWLVMGFNKQAQSEAAYKAFSAKYPLVYQSPVRNNPNHGRNHPFFFAVFDTKKPSKAKTK